MRLLLLLALAGCSSAQIQVAVKVVCRADEVIVPIAQPIIATIPAPGVGTAVTVDQLLVHPAVVAACHPALTGTMPVQATIVGAAKT